MVVGYRRPSGPRSIVSRGGRQSVNGTRAQAADYPRADDHDRNIRPCAWDSSRDVISDQAKHADRLDCPSSECTLAFDSIILFSHSDDYVWPAVVRMDATTVRTRLRAVYGRPLGQPSTVRLPSAGPLRGYCGGDHAFDTIGNAGGSKERLYTHCVVEGVARAHCRLAPCS